MSLLSASKATPQENQSKSKTIKLPKAKLNKARATNEEQTTSISDDTYHDMHMVPIASGGKTNATKQKKEVNPWRAYVKKHFYDKEINDLPFGDKMRILNENYKNEKSSTTTAATTKDVTVSKMNIHAEIEQIQKRIHALETSMANLLRPPTDT